MKNLNCRFGIYPVHVWILLFCQVSGTACQPMENDEPGFDVAAYIWPSCHHDARFGDMLWPEGKGEWEIIRKGTSRFDGHYQPKVPLWGYEMDDDPKVMERWIDAATDHGINTFIFDWYWFDGGPFLESSVNNGFLKARNNEKMKFYLMWANHDVKKNYWNVHQYPDDESQLWEGGVDLNNFKIIVDRVINQYFNKPNYYKIDGKPVFSIFALWNLIEGLEGVEQTREALDYFREETKKAGFPGLHLQLIVFNAPSPEQVSRIQLLKFNSVTKYNWGWSNQQDYIRWGTKAMEQRQAWDEALQIPYFPNVSIGWDDTPRFPAKGQADIVRFNKSPDGFSSFVEMARKYCESHPDEPNLITIFSWNEWIEGGYLLPDVKYGFRYLEAVRKVMMDQYDPYSNKNNDR